MFRRLLPAATGCLLSFASAYAQQGTAATVQSPQQPITGQLLSAGFEVKAVINNTYLILQKGDKTYWCGSSDPGLTWANWPQLTRDAPCVSLNK